MLYLVALAVVLGDGLGNLHVYFPVWVAAVFAAAAVMAFLARWPACGLAAGFFGLCAIATVPVRSLLTPPVTHASLRSFSDGEEVELRGELVRPSAYFPGRVHLFVAVSGGSAAGESTRPLSGMVRVTFLGFRRFRIGSQVDVEGRIRFQRDFGDPGEFDYRAYLARQGIAATMVVMPGRHGQEIRVTGYRPRFPASWIESVRGRIGEFIDANLVYPERAEMRALVIGDRGGIDDRLRNRFARVGMAHLLVISGLHLGLVAAAVFVAVRLALGLLPRLIELGYANKIAALMASIAVTAYAAIAGGHVSTTRALVMVLAYMLAVLIDRPREALASLALAALVICVAIPGSSADIGFQLSFVSVLGIVLGMRRFAGWWEERFPSRVRSPWMFRIVAAIAGYAAVSFWASIATAPLTAFYFNQVSLAGVAANAIVVPLMGLGATVLGLAASALSFVWLWPASVLMRVAGWLLALSTALAGWFVALPWSWTHIFTPTVLELALAYALLMLWLTARPASRRLSPSAQEWPAGFSFSALQRWRGAAAAIIVCAIIADAGWWTYRRYFDPFLRVTFLSVGEGDAAVIQFPGSHVMLIDGGPRFRSGFDLGERVVAPYLWSRKIMHVDYIVMSHPHIDHFGGLRFIVRNFSPREFWWTGASSRDIAYVRLQASLEREHVRMRLLDSATAPVSIGGVTLRCLSSRAGARTKANDLSMVLRLALGRMSFLFTGDMEAPEERRLLADGASLGASVLKVPHHGSRTSSIPAFVEAVRPSFAVVSVGYRNRFHFPSGAVLERYRETGAAVLRTDQAGAITIVAAPSGIIALRTYRQGLLNLPKRLTAASKFPSGRRARTAAPARLSTSGPSALSVDGKGRL